MGRKGVTGILVGIAVFFFAACPATAGTLHFRTVDVRLETDGRPLSAYQVEILYNASAAYLVGVEGGEGSFASAPYYDPRGLTAGRIVIAAFNTKAEEKARTVRVARLHLAIRSDETTPLDARLVTAAGREGSPFVAKIILTWNEGGE